MAGHFNLIMVTLMVSLVEFRMHPNVISNKLLNKIASYLSFFSWYSSFLHQ